MYLRNNAIDVKKYNAIDVKWFLSAQLLVTSNALNLHPSAKKIKRLKCGFFFYYLVIFLM